MAMATMTRVERALDALVEGVPILLAEQGHKPDSCVLATRVACLALGEVGIKASPLPCRFDGYSPRYVRAVSDGEIAYEPDREHADEAVQRRLLSEGAWTVRIGHPANEGVLRPDGRRGFNGHLVALVERRHALDLTIHQASRPVKGMIFNPHHFRVDQSFLSGEPVAFRCGDSVAVYMKIDKNTYTVVPDWTMVRRDSRLVRETVKMLRRAS